MRRNTTKNSRIFVTSGTTRVPPIFVPTNEFTTRFMCPPTGTRANDYRFGEVIHRGNHATLFYRLLTSIANRIGKKPILLKIPDYRTSIYRLCQNGAIKVRTAVLNVNDDFVSGCKIAVIGSFSIEHIENSRPFQQCYLHFAHT